MEMILFRRIKGYRKGGRKRKRERTERAGEEERDAGRRKTDRTWTFPGRRGS